MRYFVSYRSRLRVVCTRKNVLLAICELASVLHADVVAGLCLGDAITWADDLLGDTHSESCVGERGFEDLWFGCC